MDLEETICEKCNSVLFVGSDSIGLDTTITIDLFVEGLLNDIRHLIQGMRKKCGYSITDRIIVCSDTARWICFDTIRHDVLAEVVFCNIPNGCDMVDEVRGIKIGIKKYED